MDKGKLRGNMKTKTATNVFHIRVNSNQQPK